MNIHIKKMTQAAVIAALYVGITLIFAPISFSIFQFRISESLMLLAALTPAAIPGLFLGCLLGNIYGGFGLIDIIFGSLASLLAAFLTNYIAKKLRARLKKLVFLLLLPLPSIIINALIVGSYLPFLAVDVGQASQGFWFLVGSSIFSVFVGQFFVLYFLGIPLYLAIDRSKIFEEGEGYV